MATNLIIGSGYLGSFIKQVLTDVDSTSLLSHEADFVYDLKDGFIDRFQNYENLIITCDICPLESHIQSFAEEAKKHFKTIIIISSASLYQVKTPNEEIDEKSTREGMRADLEKHFEDSAYIFSLGLLWDEITRRPERWFSRIKNGQKLINLSNAELVAQICRQVIISPSTIPTGHYILVDGPAKRWQDLSHIELKKSPVGIESKALKNSKIIQSIGKKINFSDFLYHKQV